MKNTNPSFFLTSLLFYNNGDTIIYFHAIQTTGLGKNVFVGRYWKPALIKAGVPYRNLYQMRHSFASLMIANGEGILWVNKMLGHKEVL